MFLIFNEGHLLSHFALLKTDSNARNNNLLTIKMNLSVLELLVILC